MGKKAPVKPKAKAKEEKPAEPVEEESAEQLEKKRLWLQRREASKWVQAQLTLVRGQLEAAKAAAKTQGNNDWLQIAHEFHEIRLIRVAKRLEEKTLDNVPQELRDGLEAYLKQCAAGPLAQQEGFEAQQEIWELLEAEGGEAYKRPAEAPEALEAAEKLKAWADASSQGVSQMCGLMKANAGSAGVQEAGLVRMGWLLSEGQRQEDMGGLGADALMPQVEAAMKAHLKDCEVQRAGCAALRGIAIAPGQLPGLCLAGGVQLAVDAVREHYKQKELVMSANAAFWEMAKAAGRNSPELSKMREADVVGVLKKCMDHHAWDQTLCGKVRVVLPFITED